uniref:Uncharacterized protein n=1 Tax=Solanum lycopersicum TaxID=4081 RepID=K4B4R1_SOLLC
MQARVALKASSLKIQDHGFRTRHCASSSRSLGGSLRASFLKLRGVAPQASGARLACSRHRTSSLEGAGAAHSRNHTSSSVSKGGVLRVS